MMVITAWLGTTVVGHVIAGPRPGRRIAGAVLLPFLFGLCAAAYVYFSSPFAMGKAIGVLRTVLFQVWPCFIMSSIMLPFTTRRVDRRKAVRAWMIALGLLAVYTATCVGVAYQMTRHSF